MVFSTVFVFFGRQQERVSLDMVTTAMTQAWTAYCLCVCFFYIAIASFSLYRVLFYLSAVRLKIGTGIESKKNFFFSTSLDLFSNLHFKFCFYLLLFGFGRDKQWNCRHSKYSEFEWQQQGKKKMKKITIINDEMPFIKELGYTQHSFWILAFPSIVVTRRQDVA